MESRCNPHRDKVDHANAHRGDQPLRSRVRWRWSVCACERVVSQRMASVHSSACTTLLSVPGSGLLPAACRPQRLAPR